jgi:hypothetical protein
MLISEIFRTPVDSHTTTLISEWPFWIAKFLGLGIRDWGFEGKELKATRESDRTLSGYQAN